MSYETSTTKEVGEEGSDGLLLSPAEVKKIVSLFGLNDAASVDLLKALEQAKQRTKIK